MSKKEIDIKIQRIAKESRQTIKAGDEDWPVGEMPEPPKGKITGDWPLGFVLRTKPEVENFSKKINQQFGVKPKFSKSTKLTDIAAMVHSLRDKDKT